MEPQVEPDWQYKLEQKDKKIARLEKNNKQMLELINSSPIILEQLKKDLINACKIGDLAKIKFLIETMKVDPNYTNFDAITLPYTLLEVACSYGHIDIVKYFIEQIKMDPNIIDIKGYNVLFYARSRDMAKYLVEQAKVDPNIKSRYGTVSEEAVKNSLLDIVKYFIEELHLEPNIIDSAGRTILHYATRDKDMTKYLIEQVKWIQMLKIARVKCFTLCGYIPFIRYC